MLDYYEYEYSVIFILVLGFLESIIAPGVC